MVYKTRRNTEKLATYGIQDEEKHRETDNIWYTRRGETNQKTQHNMCSISLYANKQNYSKQLRRRGRDPMVVGFTTTYAINVSHH